MSLFAGQPALSSPSDPLVSTDDFTEWYGIANVTTTDAARIQTALEIASAQIRNGRRRFDAVTNETVTIDGSGRRSLILPRDRLPVTDVSSITQLFTLATDYTAVDATTYDWDEHGIVTLSRPLSLPFVWTPRRRGVIVTYSHGYAVLPREVAGVCLGLAKRLYDNPSGASVQSKTLGDYSVTYTGAAAGLTVEETALLAQYEVIAVDDTSNSLGGWYG